MAYLADGFLDGDLLECPLHGACFNIRTGKAETPPAFENVPTYQVKVEGSDILLGPEN
jgi:nitrite reductase/ring-hydroxylating ferredoxin subunit